jgi:hypothetical protein
MYLMLDCNVLVRLGRIYMIGIVKSWDTTNYSSTKQLGTVCACDLGQTTVTLNVI